MMNLFLYIVFWEKFGESWTHYSYCCNSILSVCLLNYYYRLYACILYLVFYSPAGLGPAGYTEVF